MNIKGDVEKELLEFLRTQREADIAGTLKRVANSQLALEVKSAERHSENQGAIRGLSLRVGELEKDRDKIEGKLDSTGSWQLEDLRERSKYSSRLIATTLITLAVAILSGGVGVLITMFTRK